MIKNYLKIAWRNLTRNKGFAITNLLGLTIGITCTIFIFLWVKDEVTFDKFNTNYKSIYQVMANRDFKNNVFTDPNMVFPLSALIQKNVPQVQNAVMTSHVGSVQVAYHDKKLKKQVIQVGGRYFDMFTCKFIKGNALTTLAEPNTVTITQSTAKALFGNADPINKTLKVDNVLNVKVVAVIADLPGNSTQQFDVLAPFDYSDPQTKSRMNEWRNSGNMVYIQTVTGASIAGIEKSINQIMFDHNHDKISTYFTFAMSKWHLYSDFKDGKNIGGMIEYVNLFSIIAIVILLIACINFMNLSTARSEKRAKEVGIRKTLGSSKKQLVIQFFSESMILTLAACILSVMAVYILMPAFNVLVSKQLVFGLSDPVFWFGILVIIVFTGVIAGSYPALYLSSFNPVKVLKGTFAAGKSAILPRRILVVGQFVISILLISATIIIYQQIQHVKNRDIGYNPSNLIQVPATDGTDKNYAAIKHDLLSSGLVYAVTRTSSPITDIWWKSPSPRWDGMPANASIIFSGEGTDADFTKTMGIKMVAGHDFTGQPIDSATMLLNQAAVQAMNLKHPIGMQLNYNNREYTVIGVTSNVVMQSPFTPVDPMMVYYQPGGSSFISLRLNNGAEPKKAIALLSRIYTKYSPVDIFEYQFVDQEFGKKFITEDLIGNIANIFAGLAIFICCMGLAGLASFTIEKRFREIGIRKIMGATLRQLLMLITREFLKLITIAFVIAVPLTWWLMNNWLQKYTYRIGISIWLFGAVGVLILLLTLIIVTVNTLSAAMTNPVKSLRSE
jgi:putative ABC transport system permease protein